MHTLQVETIDASIGLDKDFQFPQDFPAKYKQQILASNFTRLSDKLDATLASVVVPEINKRFVVDIFVCSPVVYFFTCSETSG